jgi:hypothetical protein
MGASSSGNGHGTTGLCLLIGLAMLSGCEGDTGASGSTGGAEPTSPKADACHAEGVWDPATGTYATLPLADGTLCEDGNACTLGDSCQSGECVAGAPKTCSASDECHLAGVCDPTTGACSNPPDPVALGSLAARCGPLPLLLDSGYGTLGLLPHIKKPGTWNPYLIDGNQDAASRTALYDRAHALGVRPYWLVYGNVFEGLSGVERARGKTPDPSDPKGRGLADECASALDYGGSTAACVAHYDSCGGIVGDSTPQGIASTVADWIADRSIGFHQDSNTHPMDAPTGLLPDDVPVRRIDALQVDFEGACYGQLLSTTPDAMAQAQAIDFYRNVFNATELALSQGSIGAGTGSFTELGLYGVPAAPVTGGHCSPYSDNPNMGGPPYPYGDLGYWTDECRYLVAQDPAEKCGGNTPARCDAERLTVTSLGTGYSTLARLIPWMYFTNQQPWEHPAFSWLPPNDDGDPSTFEGDDVVSWADGPTYAPALLQRFFTGTYSSTSMPSLNRLVGDLPGTVLFPALYQSAGRIEQAWGDPSDNAWWKNIVGRGAAAFEHRTSGHADPHIAKVFEHLLLENLENAQLSNRLLLEVAWGWKLFTGRRLAPIITITPGGAVRAQMERDPANPTGQTVCTAHTEIARVDTNLPNRCGPVPPDCSMPNFKVATGLPAHPGRTLVYHRWNAATQAYEPDMSDPNRYTYVAAGVEVSAHQSLDEFEYTQLRPMLQAVPRGEIDAVVSWPDTTALAGLCAGQGRRLRYGGGFHYLKAYGGYEDTGVPEPTWLRFFAPGPLTAWCHTGHEPACRQVYDWTKACGATDECEPHWPTLASDIAVEEVCAEAVATYMLERWARVREVFEEAQVNPPPPTRAFEPTAFCGYLETWFEAELSVSPARAMCQ